MIGKSKGNENSGEPKEKEVSIVCLRPGDIRLLCTREAAAILGLQPVTLHIDRVKGNLGIPFVKLGSKAVRYRASDLIDWMGNLQGRTNTSQI